MKRNVVFQHISMRETSEFEMTMLPIEQAGRSCAVSRVHRLQIRGADGHAALLLLAKAA